MEILIDVEFQRFCLVLVVKNVYWRVGCMFGVCDRDIDIIREEIRGDLKEFVF